MRILVLGSGPIFPSQGGEFESSGTQTIRAIQNLGHEAWVLNNNSASIQLQPGFADRVFIAPVQAQELQSIVQKSPPDLIFCHAGGQTALNCALETPSLKSLFAGTPPEQIRRSESRQEFDLAVSGMGLKCPSSDPGTFPLLARTEESLGGLKAHILRTQSELENLLIAFPTTSFHFHHYLEGFTEFEFEVVRDSNGSSLVIAALQNLDPAGIHTGDSKVICPPTTLPASLYYSMREAALRLANEFELLGEANIQFALNPKRTEFFVLEMNLRLSRSSCLASRITGWPIAYITAQLLLGKTLKDFPEYAHEPRLNFFAQKTPLFQFERFPGCLGKTGPNMQSLGESLCLGTTLEEAMGEVEGSCPRSINRFGGTRRDPSPIHFLSKYEDPEYSPLPQSILIVGPGPYRIGTSLEFDSFLLTVMLQLKQAGKPVQILNENPASSICDPLFSDRIWLQKPGLKNLEHILDYEKPDAILLAGAGQRGQELSLSLQSPTPILGHPISSIRLCEDRQQFEALLKRLKLPYLKPQAKPEFPCILRPSHVLGGESMRVLTKAEDVTGPTYPFLEDWQEMEADIIALNGEILALVFHEQVEPAGIHSGDSTLISPPCDISSHVLREAEHFSQILIQELNATGPLNLQFLYKNHKIMILECNLRASRTLPFSALSSEQPLLELAAWTLTHFYGTKKPNLPPKNQRRHWVRKPYFAWDRIRGSRPELGVEMRSVGESCQFREIKSLSNESVGKFRKLLGQ